jgi:hypothetical protein
LSPRDSPRGASRVASDFPIQACRRHYPGGFAESVRSWSGLFQPRLLRQRCQPSPCHCRVGTHIKCFGACSTFTRVTACLIAGPPCGPLSRRLRRFRYLHRRSDSFRLERPSCRGAWLPLEIRNLSRRTLTPISVSRLWEIVTHAYAMPPRPAIRHAPRALLLLARCLGVRACKNWPEPEAASRAGRNQ